MGRPLLWLLVLAILGGPVAFLEAQTGSQGRPAGGHRGAVNALAAGPGGRIFSAGEDGFLCVWDIQTASALDRFQISPYSLKALALRPESSHIAFVESDGLDLYRISAWDYERKANLFTLSFRDPVVYIAYSAGGNFLIAAMGEGGGVLFIRCETGEIFPSPPALTGNVQFAATGRSERTMIAYETSGTLSYWELGSGSVMQRFQVSADMASPLLFGGNRFFAGFDREGLAILDAVSGNVIIRDRSVSSGVLASRGTESPEFYCISQDGAGAAITHYVLDNTGRLQTKNRLALERELWGANLQAGENAALLGSPGGKVWVWEDEKGGRLRLLSSADQVEIREAAVSGGTIALLTENNNSAFIPLDYRNLKAAQSFRLENSSPYTSISAGGKSPVETFIFWKSGLSPPALKNPSANGPPAVLDKLPLRFPLRSVSALGDAALFLDTMGYLTVLSLKTGEVIFSFSSLGSMDAAFVDSRHIIIGRSVFSSQSPFLIINIETGETVSLSYGAAAGARVYRGGSGALYAAAVNQAGGNVTTTLLRLDAANSFTQDRLFEIMEEDTTFSIAESAGTLAVTLGGQAVIWGGGKFTPFERSPGLSLRLLDGGGFFISLDGAGDLAWYDNKTGKLLALLRFYEREWILELENGRTLRGPLTN